MSAPVLLLDAGNSRLKWALATPGGYLAQGSLGYGERAQLPASLAGFDAPRAALGCNVAGPQVAAELAAQLAPLTIDWLRPVAAQAGLRNGYREPGQLGADRWAALIGARGLAAGDCIVAMAGTALTVDALSAEGDFLGGLIVPGFRLMRQALAQGTADLGLPGGEPADFPRSTGEAIVNGALAALAGAIEQARGRLERHTGRPAQLLLSGGDGPLLAPLLAPALAERLIAVDNLVLRGLARLAFNDPERKPLP
ncbi:type III pantothenate kinase [Chitinimonas koreensis]|uniref:type III pantothenate kinase n=1 Tax=Chitinimonas koreensis TaxID=356302 RepID=UPI000421360A|nr:type III pantothenate kinase [Chitinimonas koreensis]QNM96367.1 type III pantothenate kinase [Chitinimonas koreensis]